MCGFCGRATYDFCDSSDLCLTRIHHDVYHEDMSRTQIYLEKSQLDALRTEAARRRGTVSAVIRELIREKFARTQRQHSMKIKHETLLEAAERINRLGIKGPRDLAKNMDKYLYGRI